MSSLKYPDELFRYTLRNYLYINQIWRKLYWSHLEILVFLE